MTATIYFKAETGYAPIVIADIDDVGDIGGSMLALLENGQPRALVCTSELSHVVTSE